jgi:hypothetical protein
MDIQQFGKGGIEKPFDYRDYRFEKTKYAGATLEEFDLEPFLNPCDHQGKSLSCVGQAVGSYAEGLNAIETGIKEKFSKRAIYSNVRMGNGGSWTTEAITFWQNWGMFYEKDYPDYENGNPPSEDFMSQSQY